MEATTIPFDVLGSDFVDEAPDTAPISNTERIVLLECSVAVLDDRTLISRTGITKRGIADLCIRGLLEPRSNGVATK